MKVFSVIKNDSPEDALIWKFPSEDFNTNSQLIVAESEEAIFVKDGIALSVFEGGKYTLSTNNYFILSKLRNILSEGVSSFNCKVYFVNKAHKLELLWGTESPIPMRDYEFGFLVGVRANGAYSLQVENSKKFLIKLVGNNVHSFTKTELNKYFRTAFSMNIKTKLATVMKEMKVTVFDMATEYVALANELRPTLNEVLDEYGVRLVNFYINNISIPENDPNYNAINTAYQKKAEIKIQGDDWGRISSREILKDVANNPNSGGIAAAGAGFGMGIAAGGAIGHLAHQMIAPLNSQQKDDQPNNQNKASRFIQKNIANIENINCPNCNSENPKNSKFCNECGEKIQFDIKKCSNCGAEMPNNAKFCNECGEKIL